MTFLNQCGFGPACGARGSRKIFRLKTGEWKVARTDQLESPPQIPRLVSSSSFSVHAHPSYWGERMARVVARPVFTALSPWFRFQSPLLLTCNEEVYETGWGKNRLEAKGGRPVSERRDCSGFRSRNSPNFLAQNKQRHAFRVEPRINAY